MAKKWIATVLLGVGLACVVLMQTAAFDAGTSMTYDEPGYLELGRQLYYKHTFQGFIRPMAHPSPSLLRVSPRPSSQELLTQSPQTFRDLPVLPD